MSTPEPSNWNIFQPDNRNLIPGLHLPPIVFVAMSNDTYGAQQAPVHAVLLRRNGIPATSVTVRGAGIGGVGLPAGCMHSSCGRLLRQPAATSTYIISATLPLHLCMRLINYLPLSPCLPALPTKPQAPSQPVTPTWFSDRSPSITPYQSALIVEALKHPSIRMLNPDGWVETDPKQLELQANPR